MGVCVCPVAQSCTTPWTVYILPNVKLLQLERHLIFLEIAALLM